MTSPDVLSNLLQASWRGIAFPTVAVDASATHGVVVHLRMDRNGRRLENTGFHGRDFNYKIPLINTLARGPTETWHDLMPDTYRRLNVALEDRTTGNFVHPLLGLRRCKVLEWTETVDPDFRGGPTLTVKWSEDTEGGDAVLSQVGSSLVAQTAALSLDSALGLLIPPPDLALPEGIFSLTDFLKFLGTIVDQADLVRQQWEGKVNRVIGALNTLAGKLYGDTSVSTGLKDDLARLIATLHEHKRSILRLDKSTSLYIVPKATTLAALAPRLRNTPGQLANLNPALVGKLKVEIETPVRYYL